MSELQPNEHFGMSIDARVLTATQDSTARLLAKHIGGFIADRAGEIVESDKSADDLREFLLLTPYALMYATHAAIEGTRDFAGPGQTQIRDGCRVLSHE